MRLQFQTCLLVAVGCLFIFCGQVQAQCTSCNQAAAAPVYVQDASYQAAPIQATAGCGCKKGCGNKRSCGCKSKGGYVDGCRPTAATVVAELPNLPIRTACDSPWGMGDVPSLFTRPRSYTPPIGKAVGRPLFGAWNGF